MPGGEAAGGVNPNVPPTREEGRGGTGRDPRTLRRFLRDEFKPASFASFSRESFKFYHSLDSFSSCFCLYCTVICMYST